MILLKKEYRLVNVRKHFVWGNVDYDKWHTVPEFGNRFQINRIKEANKVLGREAGIPFEYADWDWADCSLEDDDDEMCYDREFECIICKHIVQDMYQLFTYGKCSCHTCKLMYEFNDFDESFYLDDIYFQG